MRFFLLPSWFQLQPDQCQKLVGAFKNLPQTRQDGIDFDGKKFTCVRCDSDSIYAKHVSLGDVIVAICTLVSFSMSYILLFQLKCIFIRNVYIEAENANFVDSTSF